MSQHTPGPWFNNGSVIRSGYDRDQNVNNYVAQAGSESCDYATQHANARLIAAAPDLLKALQATVDELIDAGFGASPYGLTKASIGIELGLAAIAKAKGAA